MLDFVYSKNTDFVDGDLGIGYSSMPSDANTLRLVRTGKGNPDNFDDLDYIFLPAMFGGIEPADDFWQVVKGAPPELTAKGDLGSNNIVSAKAVMGVW